MDIKLGNVIIPKAASPNAHIASSSAIPPTKVKKSPVMIFSLIKNPDQRMLNIQASQ